jgi:hypothetical protein
MPPEQWNKEVVYVHAHGASSRTDRSPQAGGLMRQELTSPRSATMPARGGLMDILELLKAERDKTAQQVNALDSAIAALRGLNSTRVSRGPRKMSAAARAKIAASQRERWAKQKGQKVVSISAKHRISAGGLANIRAAQRARWTKQRASSNRRVASAPKRHISAAGLARIRAANRARWVKWRRKKAV